MTLAGLSTGTAPTAPPRAVALASGVGVAAALVVPAGPPGVGLVLIVWVTAVVAVRLTARRLRGWQAVHAGAALALLCCAAVRDAPWLVAADLAAAVAVGSLALVPARSWPGVVAGAAGVLRTLPPAAPWLVRGVRHIWPQARTAAPVVRGLALSAVVLLVFVPLLASADAAFAAVLQRLTAQVPSAQGLPARLAAGLLAAVTAGAVLQLLVWPRRDPLVPAPRRLARRAEWLLPLLALDGLLAAFLVVHASVLLGGGQHVLDTAGVTYASYAREGFGQLVAVTALVLAVVAAAARWAPRGARPLLGVLCGLALVVDVSALARLHLYVEAYGLTRLRIAAIVGALWLGIVLLLVLAAGRRPGPWLPHAVVVSASASLLLLTAADPDARIAESALDRGAAADLAYLAGLSADAVPVLDRLPEPVRSCVLPGPPPDRPWTSANLARDRADDVVLRRPVGACRGRTG
jgi:hypothetical protein